MQKLPPIKKGDAVALLGFGRANRAVAEWLLGQGILPVAYVPTAVGDEAVWRARGVRFAVGELPAVLDEPCLVRSPGIRPDIAPIRASVARGAWLTSEAELFLAHCPCRVIGVTGSDGKTTTATLAAEMLRAAGYNTHLGGNIGVPLLPRVADMCARDVAVLELSSFQLMTLRHSPHTAVITNITPNHLNWHTDMDEYVMAKYQICCRGASRLVVNADNAATYQIGRNCELKKVYFTRRHTDRGFLPPHQQDATAIFVADGNVVLSKKEGDTVLCRVEDMRLAGAHNLENLMAAAGAVAELVTPRDVALVARSFGGVPHRMQHVGTVGGVTYINSSIDTTPTRTAATLAAMPDTRPIVIAGGRGKGLDMSSLGKLLSARAKAVFLYGDEAVAIDAAIGGGVPTERYADFDGAFAAAARTARAGDTVLLSPASTAFGEFCDFEERGRRFAALVAALPQKE